MADFTIRVYGLVFHRQHLLVVDEFIFGKAITKFPGGGLEYGEGTRDCLKRELKEECGLEVEIGNHFYTTDFFQQSQFHQRPLQVVSVYYLVNLDDNFELPELKSESDDDTIVGFRWLPVNELIESDLSLPIDKVVVGMILNKRFHFIS